MYVSSRRAEVASSTSERRPDGRRQVRPADRGETRRRRPPDRGGELPVAISNPIFVDADGDGFKPSRDTLGAPLPVKKGGS
jgi:hypothetical protein